MFRVYARTGVILMNLTISGHHLEVTPALRERVVNGLQAIDSRLQGFTLPHYTVLLTVEKLKEKKLRQKALLSFHLSQPSHEHDQKGRDFVVTALHKDLYAAIDQLMDKLNRKVQRYKRQLPQTLQHRRRLRRVCRSLGRVGREWAPPRLNAEPGTASIAA